MTRPCLSIITATFNAAATLADNLRCVAGQTTPVEHLLIDGCSTDETLAVAKTHGNHLMQVISEPDHGIYDAMDKGISLATGEVVGILNADDFYPAADTLEKVAQVFENPAVDACYGDLVYVKQENNGNFRPVRYWRSGVLSPRKFYWGWMPPHPTFFVRRSMYDQFGKFNLDLGTAADYELMLRFLLKHRINVVYVPEVLVHMRVGGASNASLGARLRANRNDRRAWQINELTPYPWTFFCKPLRKIPQFLMRPA